MPLRYRLTLIMFALGAACVALLVGDRLWLTRQMLIDRRAHRAEAFAEVAAHGLRPHLLAADRATIEGAAAEYLELPGVQRVTVTAPGGAVLADAARPDAVPALPATFVLKRPSRISGLRVAVALAPPDISAALSLMMYRGIILAAVGLALIGAVAWYAGGLLGRRLTRLMRDIERLSGIPSPVPDASSRDEVERLIGAFRRLRKSLAHEKRRRVKLARARRDFVNMLVHDMKSPLTVIQTAAMAAARDESLDDDVRDKLLGPAVRASRKLARMIEDILQMERLQSAGVPIALQPVRAGGLLQNAAAEARPLVLAAGHDWSLDVAEDAAAAILNVDAMLLQRVISNLVMNAVEHTGKNGAVALAGRLAADGRLEIVVRDCGPGVPADQHGKLFRKFHSLSADAANVGLGLAFCKLAVERHGGEIGVRAARPRGAEFYLRLPVAQTRDINREKLYQA